MGYEFSQQGQVWVTTPDEDDDKTTSDDEGTDPTAQSGTLDTSDTTGSVQSADAISGVFTDAEEAAAVSDAPEGALGWSDEEIEAAEQRNLAHGGQTTDTTGDGIAPVSSEADAVAASQQAAADTGTEDEQPKFDGRKDPGDYTVAEVKAYLSGATDKQVESVKAKEAKGQNRVGIMNY